MSVDRAIKAFPTIYRGRTYRSRLEARWAAFFDGVGWRHEYEPYDLGSWSPDFLLRAPKGDILVEVKPITYYDDDVGRKAINACFERGLNAELGGVLILGTAPWWSKSYNFCCIGWLLILDETKNAATMSEAPIYWSLGSERPSLTADIFRSYSDFSGYTALFSDDDSDDRYMPDARLGYPEYALEVWARATSTVQWLGANNTPPEQAP